MTMICVKLKFYDNMVVQSIIATFLNDINFK